ncbi:MAG: SDR family oxidoreductase [Gammaproteobacteria bacterium]
MTNKSILITGCSSGIGFCVAEGLKKRGYQVFATARQEDDVEKLRRQNFNSLQLNLDDSDSISRAVDGVLEKTGGELYALFNNGGYGQLGALEDVSRETLRAQFETNLFGCHELTRRIIPVMRKQGYGRIIQNSSLLGFVALPYRGSYNATKFAMEGWTDTLRLELHNSGIYVSLIQPGPILTRFRVNAYAMFKKNIDLENSAHRSAYEDLERKLAKEGTVVPFTLGPGAVLKKVIHALESRHPKPRYRVTAPTHLFSYLKRLLPVRVLDAVLRRI